MVRAIILNQKVKTACDVAGGSRSEADEASVAQKTMKHLPTQGRSATAWIAATMLAMTWASETQSTPDHARHLADAQHAMAARNFDSDGIAGYGEFGPLPPGRDSNDKSVQVAQATTGDAGHAPEREHHWAETLLDDLTIARRDVELLQRLEQEHDRAERLEQALAAARRDVETQTALVEKAVEEASRLKQVGKSGTADVQTSLQQERERSARLEQDLAAARRDVEAQTALATKAAEEILQRKQAAEVGAGELRRSMQKEREGADTLAQDLSMMRSAIYAYEAQARKAGDQAAGLRQAVANGAPSLCKSAEDEHDRSERLEQHLAVARRDIETQTALAAKASEEASRLKQASESSEAELQKLLQQERERSARLEQHLAVARRDVETQTALAAKASEEGSRLKQASESNEAELQNSLQQGRERSARLEQDLAAARGDAETQMALAAKASEEASRLKQASESSEAELQKSLQQERERFARLQQDLATARRDVETQTALAAKATEEVPRAKRAAEADAAELRKSMQKERERADALAQGLSMTRSALYAYEAHARKVEDEAAELRRAAANGAPSLRKSAQDGRDQTTRLEQDLVTARRDLDTQAALAAKASEEVARTRQTAERDSASLRSSLQQERARAEQLKRDLALAKQLAPSAVTLGAIARDKPTENAKSVADGSPAASVQSDAQPNSKKAGVAAALLSRASALLGQGDIGAARIVLERAVEMGSVQASFSLAETYDPLILAKWGTLGTRGDAVRAQDLYAKADAAGIKEAKARIEALRR
ncbi:hypothetical protein IVB22_04130 [Bradyrhizobium sp. 190]|uniref:hypothetical protein n=1 Tax=Bradyrhizobium sp. 190 TaxID=2782658 RepID=UPI001FFBF417|nr:hypothetical protein [Bradyrhizobium sp. 190]MCK1511762.1 hypothetical protein [Bradyrhizobium sp. 190]